MFKKVFMGFATLFVSAIVQSLLSISVYANTTASLFPVANGKYAQWSTHGGSIHYTNVDETPCDGTTTYNSTGTLAKRDSYSLNISSIPNYSTITAIAITPCASENSNGPTAVMNLFYVWEGNDSADAGSYSLSGTTPTTLSATTFNSLNLLRTPTSTLETGAVYSSGNKGVRLSNISAVITYTLPNSPSAPSNLVATNASATSNNLTWQDNSDNEDSFNIERSTNSTNNFSFIASVSANTTSYTDSGLSTNQTYYYRVYAKNAGGNSAYSNIAYAITATVAPSAPSSLAATNSGATTNNLSWHDNSTNEDGFKIERSVNSLSNFTFLASTSANTTSYTDSGLSTDQTYYYRIYAFNVKGNSPYSNTSYAITATVVPSTPSNLVATNSAASRNILTWTDNSTNEDGFKIERSTNNLSNFTYIASVSANTTSYWDQGLQADQTYYYRIYTFNAIGNSSYSNTSYAITETVVPGDPSNLSATNGTDSATLSWQDNSTNEEQFNIERSTDDINFTQIGTAGINTTQYTDSNLTTGTYFYRVRAQNSIGFSNYTNEVSVTIP